MRTKKKLEDFRDTFGVVKDSRGNLKFTKAVKEDDLDNFISNIKGPSLISRVLNEIRTIPFLLFILLTIVVFSPLLLVIALCRYFTNFFGEDKE